MRKSSIEQLLEIFEPFEKKIKDVNVPLGVFHNSKISNPESQRLERIKNTYILMLLKAFVESPINIEIQKSETDMKYTVYWVDRRKYFKESKKQLMEFFSRFIRVIHSNENLALVDLKLSGTRRIIMLIERSESAK
jgi:hypothetical protein